MKLVTIREKIVRYRTLRVSRSKAARLWVKRFYPHKMSQSAIARHFKVSVQCVNEQVDALGLIARHG